MSFFSNRPPNADGLRRTYNDHVNKPAPTRNPYIPAITKRFKAICKLIMAKCHAHVDGEEERGGDASDDADDARCFDNS
jgi:hypothetical protein